MNELCNAIAMGLFVIGVIYDSGGGAMWHAVRKFPGSNFERP